MTSNIYKLVRDELRVELRAALQDARATKQIVHSKAVAVQFNGDRRHVVMHVQPPPDQTQDGFALILFEEEEQLQTLFASIRPV